MKDLIKFLLWLLIISVAAIFQINRFFILSNINPNLILLTILAMVVAEKKFLLVSLFLFFSSFFLFFLIPFWLSETTILTGMGFLCLLARKILSGNEFFDFLILIFLGTLGFYLIISPRYFLVQPGILIGELIYNLFLGFLIFGIAIFFYEKKNGIKS